MSDLVQSQQLPGGVGSPDMGGWKIGEPFWLKEISACSLGLVDIRECKQNLSQVGPVPRRPSFSEPGLFDLQPCLCRVVFLRGRNT